MRWARRTTGARRCSFASGGRPRDPATVPTPGSREPVRPALMPLEPRSCRLAAVAQEPTDRLVVRMPPPEALSADRCQHQDVEAETGDLAVAAHLFDVEV